jgi:hypothetical protein
MEWFTNCLEKDCIIAPKVGAIVSSPSRSFARSVGHDAGLKSLRNSPAKTVLKQSLRNSPAKTALKRRKMLEGPGTPKVWTEIRMKF